MTVLYASREGGRDGTSEEDIRRTAGADTDRVEEEADDKGPAGPGVPEGRIGHMSRSYDHLAEQPCRYDELAILIEYLNKESKEQSFGPRSNQRYANPAKSMEYVSGGRVVRATPLPGKR